MTKMLMKAKRERTRTRTRKRKKGQWQRKQKLALFLSTGNMLVLLNEHHFCRALPNARSLDQDDGDQALAHMETQLLLKPF